MESYITQFFTLLILEIILGVDNIIFISLAVTKILPELRNKAKYIGLSLALIMRIAVLYGASAILAMNNPIISLFQLDISPNNLFMVFGGIFLIYQSLSEIWNDIFKKNGKIHNLKSNFYYVILQIIIVDLIFSIDSILTAIGITHNILIIQIVFVVSIISTILFSHYIIKAITTYSNIKTIAIMFVLVLGILLTLNGIHIKVSHNYLYFTFAFSIITEGINIIRKKVK
ncbi:membrane protein, TerC family [Ehrlichia chaffeensis str. Arkansas]|uniref:Membrane protein, TerC family n=1 Tax=Ehrlichia chaffeensis (strain ATCC CRL-10679 / Arkansas) TaxID=205920 RepID=Q2GGQ5_EHRCR|nr:tellurium resistance protein TerC [Ehrlichia chaffeensis]ABD44799.1 membrane protein, TerC family [Ehrlichia chaffeensis str. Arkansas]AHX07703.1 integral membrane TerC family protein [Ehrlichia chaffeensis str. Osceola]AHX09151.1 integral membrane TerC family protein [Ehrlichia chaffeensis str. Wakulla]